MYQFTLQLNARLRPLDRGGIYENPIDAALKKLACGSITGGGTQLGAKGEMQFCDIVISLNENTEQSINQLLDILNQIGAPKGSYLRGSGVDLPIGTLEGLALYLNGTELPDEVYQASDPNDLIDKIHALLNGLGHLYSYWEGPEETALYFYGVSFDAMKAQMGELLAQYPLCQKCRIEQIA